jgi:hypothetical protein
VRTIEVVVLDTTVTMGVTRAGEILFSSNSIRDLLHLVNTSLIVKLVDDVNRRYCGIPYLTPLGVNQLMEKLDIPYRFEIMTALEDPYLVAQAVRNFSYPF